MKALTVLALIEEAADQLEAAGLSLANGFGQGTLNAFDEAAWLVMWRLENDFAVASKAAAAPAEDPDDEPSFTEITLDVKH